MKNKNNKNNNVFSTAHLCVISIVLIVVSVLFYLYSYQLSVARAANIENLEEKISNLKSEISEKEFEIVEARRSIDKELAINEGFVELKEVVFLKRNQATALNAQTN